MVIETTIKLCWELDGRGREVRCRDWRECAGHRWYSRHDNQYCRNQVIWIIYNSIEYAGDHYESAGWPEDPDTAAVEFNDTPVQKSQPATAGFIKDIDEITEVIKRLEATGDDGQILLHSIKRPDLDIKYYSREARNALNYICGLVRKRRSYRQWLADREYNDKKSHKNRGVR